MICRSKKCKKININILKIILTIGFLVMFLYGLSYKGDSVVALVLVVCSLFFLLVGLELLSCYYNSMEVDTRRVGDIGMQEL